MMSIDTVFQKKRVLVTGHTGFKGSWLSIWLDMLGAHVVGFALAPYSPRGNFMTAGLETHIIHIIGDVRNFSHLYEVCQACLIIL